MVSKIKVYLRQSNDQLPYFYQERSYHLYRQNKIFFVSFEILIRIIELVLNNYKFQLEITCSYQK